MQRGACFWMSLGKQFFSALIRRCRGMLEAPMRLVVRWLDRCRSLTWKLFHWNARLSRGILNHARI
jgi:hypothetical protein